MLNVRMIIICSLFILFLSSTSVTVHAQSTNVIELVSPIHTPVTDANPIPLYANVSYSGADSNYTMVVGVFDQDASTPTPVSAVAFASPYPCINQPSLNALCAIKLQNASGIERLVIKIGGIIGNHTSVGFWHLSLSVVLLDAKGGPIQQSVSNVPFEIDITPMPLLFVKVPNQVPVAVDGIIQPPGSVDGATLTVGQHTLSVPTWLSVSNLTRLRFDHWSDGLTAPNRSVYAQSDVGLEAFYASQHTLMLNSTLGVTSGAGWYDSNATASFSVSPNYFPLNGTLGMFGARLAFRGWYENGTLVSSSATGTIAMTQAHTLTAVWQLDYTIPEVIAAVAIIVVAVLAGYFTAKRHPAKKRSKSR